jgi:hypothetical protein
MFINIQPEIEKALTFEIEHKIIEYLKTTLQIDVNCFAGMGRSEILLMLRGPGFEQILPKITEIRKSSVFGKILNIDNHPQCDPNSNVFICSCSFPLISHKVIKSRKFEEQLQGRILPRVFIDCNPGCEEYVIKCAPSSCSSIRDVYGRFDLVIEWEKKTNISRFLLELTEFREKLSGIEGVRETSTSMWGENLLHLGDDEEEFATPTTPTQFVSQTIPYFNTVKDKCGDLDPYIKDKLIDLAGRLNSYYKRRRYKLSFKDMTGVLPVISEILDKIKEPGDIGLGSYYNHMSQLIDLSNHALYQRYFDVESHFETCKHLPFPFLRGINGYISAATFIPCYIFEKVFDGSSAHEAWPGFVLFGQSYSYQLLNNLILSYHASAIDRPVEEWWGISHEVAHAIYWLSDFFDSKLDTEDRKYIDDTSKIVNGFLVDVEELFANWFDLTYFFENDIEHYFPTIWNSWLRWERVWNFKKQYIFRSFAVYLSKDLDEFDRVQSISVPKTDEYLREKLSEMNTIITNSVPKYESYFSELDEVDFPSTFRTIKGVEGFLSFLERRYFDKSLLKRLHPPYPEQEICRHLEKLEQGIIITAEIPDPIKLLHRLHYKYSDSKGDINMRINAAVILTLWYHYVKKYWEN